MQYSKLSALPTLALASLAAATLTRRQENQCNAGSLQCCESTQDADNPPISGLLDPLGIVAQDITGLIGVTCSSISVIGESIGSCSEQPVCCTNVILGGVVAFGCTPININL